MIALLMTVASAQAAITTIGFDDRPHGETVTSQYEPQGVVFADGPGGATGHVPKIDEARQDDRQLGNFTGCSGGVGGEFAQCSVDLWMKFSTPQAAITFLLGHREPVQSATTVQVEFYGVLGDRRGAYNIEVSPDASLQRHTVLDPGTFPCAAYPCDRPGPAAWVHLQALVESGGQSKALLLDDLQFHTPATPPAPRFSIQRDASETFPIDTVGVRPGATTDVSIIVNRFGAVGTVALEAEAPDWLKVEFDPQSSATARRVKMKLSLAKPDAPPVDRFPLKVLARRAATSDPPQELIVPVTVTREYDLQTQGMLVTQGPQPPAGRRIATGERRQWDYGGVRLAGGKRTIAVLWANALTAPKEGVYATASLTATTADGKALKGVKTSTVFARGGSQLLKTFADDPERASSFTLQKAYVFDLPDDWTRPAAPAVKRELNLTARLHGPGQASQTFKLDPLKACATAQCLANDKFELRRVPFHRMAQQDTFFRSYDLYWAYGGEGRLALPNVGTEYYELPKLIKALIPHDERRVKVLDSLISFDVSAIVKEYDQCRGPFKKEKDRLDCISDMAAELTNVVDEYDWDNPTAPFAVPFAKIGGAGVNGVHYGSGGCQGFFGPCLNPAVSLVQVDRPLTSVAHELFHSLGEEHADTKCGGNANDQKGSDWVGDGGWGSFEGLTVDLSDAYLLLPNYPNERYVQPRFGAGLSNGELPGGRRGNLVDFMSYCATDVDAWISPQNWERRMNSFAVPASASAASARAAYAASAASVREPTAALGGLAQKRGSGLRITGFLRRGTAQITDVRPTNRLASQPTGDSPLTLRVSNSGGEELATARLRMRTGHADGAGALTTFAGEIPMSAASMARSTPSAPAAVTVMNNGRPVATRLRSPSTPLVRLRQPRGGTVGKRQKVEVSWTATDADGGPFSTYVDYSFDDGKTWRTIHQQVDIPELAPTPQRVKLASRLFSRSKRARLRVRVNDGFNEGRGVSKRFSAVGRPPAVRITAPTKGISAMNESAVRLSGDAIDDRGRPVTKRLVWFAGKKKIATGPVASVVGLPAGRRVPIRLVARDATGRKGSARVTIRVNAAPPRILQLTTPKRVSQKAKRVVIRLRASLPSKLKITGNGAKTLTASAGFKARSYRVQLTKRRGTPLRLKIRLVAGNRKSRFALSIPVR
ncbi:MAG: hypothetical protein M3N47_03265 [Chloroflexota bacterium]|nr:hypothetical protein [Chloroflexota bacterium]